MNRVTFVLIAFIAVMLSCKKEDKNSNQEKNDGNIEASEYFGLEVGNYWIYEIFEIDTNGTEASTGKFDSVYIAKTEIINGEEYYAIEGGNYLGYRMSVRDSSGYLINSDGVILFAPNDFADTLGIELRMLSDNDTLFVGYSNMEKVEGKVELSAGNFEPLLCRNRYDIPREGVVQHRELLEYRAPGVGLIVKQCALIIDPKTKEGRLVRYSVQ